MIYTKYFTVCVIEILDKEDNKIMIWRIFEEIMVKKSLNLMNEGDTYKKLNKPKYKKY